MFGLNDRIMYLKKGFNNIRTIKKKSGLQNKKADDIISAPLRTLLSVPVESSHPKSY